MTEEDLTELNRKIAVMQAYRDGKEIQHKYIGRASPGLNPDTSVWTDSTPPHASPQWLWTMYDYRVKPVEPRRVWMARCCDSEPKLGGFYIPYDSEKAARRDKSQNIECISEFIELTDAVKEKLGL